MTATPLILRLNRVLYNVAAIWLVELVVENLAGVKTIASVAMTIRDSGSSLWPSLSSMLFDSDEPLVSWVGVLVAAPILMYCRKRRRGLVETASAKALRANGLLTFCWCCAAYVLWVLLNEAGTAGWLSKLLLATSFAGCVLSPKTRLDSC